MRFLQLVMSGGASGPPSMEHIAKINASIREKIASGAVLATGGLGKRATAAARIVREDGNVTVEDPPSGDGWMAAGGYSLTEYATKEDAIAAAKSTLEMMGDGVIELIQVSERHPASAGPARTPSAGPLGVVPYLTMDVAAEASTFYQRAFDAKEIARMPGQDGRLMHCHLEIDGGALMLSDNFPEMGLPPVQRSPSYTMQLVVAAADGDMWWTRAVDAGCKLKLPFERAPWGDRCGQLVDPFNVTWALSSPAQ